jgi:hypothetical protein
MKDHRFDWRISSYSGPDNTCVAVARAGADTVLMRNSNRPDAGTLTLDPSTVATWLAGCRAGGLDDLT